MATKATTTRKRTATAKRPAAGRATTTKKTAATAAPSAKRSASKLPMGVLYEKRPECHCATGKYCFFYVLFAVTTVVFAALSVWLFVFSSELLNKYESIEACARTRGATCEVKINEEGE